MNTVRALLVSVPSRLSRYTEPETSEPQRRRASASSRRSPRRPLSRLRSGAPLRATRRRSRRFASGWSLCSGAPSSFGWRIPKSPVRAAARQAHLTCAGVCTALFLLQRHTPTSSEYEKGEAFPPPFGVLIPTLPIQRPRFRACWNPTLSRPQSPGDRRSERSGCVRPRPVPQHLRVAWRGFR